MKLSRSLLLLVLLSLMALLGGCASSTPRMAEVRAFAAQSPKLNAYHELTERYRDTYQREQPFLSSAADVREQVLDQRRQQACDDFVKLQYGVQAYMQALGKLAGDNEYDFEDQIKAMGSGIKAWPDTGLEDRHVNAFAGLTRLLTRAIAAPAQERAVQELMRDGQQPMQELLDAMRTLLRLYDKSNDNEEKIVRGMLEVEIPYLDPARDRLLLALARSKQQEKQAEYRLIGLRYTLARNNLDAIERSHRALVDQLPPVPK
jgi:type IV secretory pathway VirJ component